LTIRTVEKLQKKAVIIVGSLTKNRTRNLRNTKQKW